MAGTGNEVAMIQAEDEKRCLSPAPSYFGDFGPTQNVHTSSLACRVRTTLPPAQPEFSMDVVEHWLAEFAARAQFDAARYAAL
jgi:hypothetical protein